MAVGPIKVSFHITFPNFHFCISISLMCRDGATRGSSVSSALNALQGLKKTAAKEGNIDLAIQIKIKNKK